MRKLPLITTQALAEVRSKQAELNEAFHLRLDQDGVETTCRKKCNHCCRHPVTISLLEGALLYQWLWKEGLWNQTLRGKLEAHSRLTLGLPPETWMLASIECPLLEKDLCVAYRARPFVCRTTYSTGFPDLCKPEEFSGRTPMVSRTLDLIRFQEFERKYFKLQDSHYRVVPLSLAVLIGERIATGKLDFEDSESALMKAYLEAL